MPSCVQTPPPEADAPPPEAAAGGLAVAGSLKASRAVADLNALNIRHKVGYKIHSFTSTLTLDPGLFRPNPDPLTLLLLLCKFEIPGLILIRIIFDVFN